MYSSIAGIDMARKNPILLENTTYFTNEDQAIWV